MSSGRNPDDEAPRRGPDKEFIKRKDSRAARAMEEAAVSPTGEPSREPTSATPDPDPNTDASTSRPISRKHSFFTRTQSPGTSETGTPNNEIESKEISGKRKSLGLTDSLKGQLSKWQKIKKIKTAEEIAKEIFESESFGKINYEEEIYTRQHVAQLTLFSTLSYEKTIKIINQIKTIQKSGQPLSEKEQFFLEKVAPFSNLLKQKTELKKNPLLSLIDQKTYIYELLRILLDMKDTNLTNAIIDLTRCHISDWVFSQSLLNKNLLRPNLEVDTENPLKKISEDKIYIKIEEPKKDQDGEYLSPYFECHVWLGQKEDIKIEAYPLFSFKIDKTHYNDYQLILNYIKTGLITKEIEDLLNSHAFTHYMFSHYFNPNPIITNLENLKKESISEETKKFLQATINKIKQDAPEQIIEYRQFFKDVLNQLDEETAKKIETLNVKETQTTNVESKEETQLSSPSRGRSRINSEIIENAAAAKAAKKMGH